MHKETINLPVVYVNDYMNDEIHLRSGEIAKAAIFNAIASIQESLNTDSEGAAWYWSKKDSGWDEIWDILSEYAEYELRKIVERRCGDEIRSLRERASR